MQSDLPDLVRQRVRVEGLFPAIAACAAFVIVLVPVGCSPNKTPQETNDTPRSSIERPAVALLLEGGPITRQSDDAVLRRIFGDANVKQDRIQIGEGETLPGTVLFPDDSTRQLMILWSDTVRHRLPSRLILRGDSSRWSLRPGITLGTTLERLEQLNGRPFTLAGFGWDYAGVVIDWRGGSVTTPARNATVYLLPLPSKVSTPSYSLVLGDKDYASDLPAMKELQSAVYQIFYDFPEAHRN
jgi:hypothetical protein